MAQHRKNTSPRRIATALAVAVAALTLTGAPSNASDQQPAPVAHVQQHRVLQPVQVTVVDNTAGTWHGVARAVRAWNRSQLVHITMADHCVAHTYCAYLDTNAHDADWLALTTPLDDTHAHVQLNTTDNPSKRLQTGLACHELGHVLGVAHPDGTQDPDTHGCIAAPNAENTTPVASDADRAELVRVVGGGGLGWGALAN